MFKFIHITLKVANMRTEQEFTVYPSKADDPCVWLQSDKRFIAVDILTGKGVINPRNQNYANSISLFKGSLPFELTEEKLKEVRDVVKKVASQQNSDGSVTIIG